MITFFEGKDFCGQVGQPWNTRWFPLPAGYSRAQFVVICKSRLGGTLSIQLQTTWDTSSVTNVGTAVGISAVGDTITDIAPPSQLGPLVRLNFDFTAGTQAMVSAYLIPKRA